MVVPLGRPSWELFQIRVFRFMYHLARPGPRSRASEDYGAATCFVAWMMFSKAFSRSLVLTIPTVRPYSTTGTAPILCWIISLAATSTESEGLMTIGQLVIAASTRVDSRYPP